MLEAGPAGGTRAGDEWTHSVNTIIAEYTSKRIHVRTQHVLVERVSWHAKYTMTLLGVNRTLEWARGMAFVVFIAEERGESAS